jgi:hypothetical protein
MNCSQYFLYRRLPVVYIWNAERRDSRSISKTAIAEEVQVVSSSNDREYTILP